MRSGIYFIVNNINFKIYIGSAVYFARRRSEHFTRLAKGIHHNEYLQRAYNKYGKEAFDFIIVELVSDLSLLLEKETAYIFKHNATNEEFGYNSCSVGRSALGRKHSSETIEKIRQGNLGKKRSKETTIKMRASLTGKKRKVGLKRKYSKRIRVPGTIEQQEHRRNVNIELAKRRWSKTNKEKENFFANLKSENVITT